MTDLQSSPDDLTTEIHHDPSIGTTTFAATGVVPIAGSGWVRLTEGLTVQVDPVSMRPVTIEVDDPTAGVDAIDALLGRQGLDVLIRPNGDEVASVMTFPWNSAWDNVVRWGLCAWLRDVVPSGLARSVLALDAATAASELADVIDSAALDRIEDLWAVGAPREREQLQRLEPDAGGAVPRVTVDELGRVVAAAASFVGDDPAAPLPDADLHLRRIRELTTAAPNPALVVPGDHEAWVRAQADSLDGPLNWAGTAGAEGDSVRSNTTRGVAVMTGETPVVAENAQRSGRNGIDWQLVESRVFDTSSEGAIEWTAEGTTVEVRVAVDPGAAGLLIRAPQLLAVLVDESSGDVLSQSELRMGDEGSFIARIRIVSPLDPDDLVTVDVVELVGGRRPSPPGAGLRSVRVAERAAARALLAERRDRVMALLNPALQQVGGNTVGAEPPAEHGDWGTAARAAFGSSNPARGRLCTDRHDQWAAGTLTAPDSARPTLAELLDAETLRANRSAR